jgi:transcription elongation factor Elf1
MMVPRFANTRRRWRLEAETYPAYICRMPETFKCPDCGALYKIIVEKTISRDKNAADCLVCGKQMDSGNGSIIPHYELVKMPDGTDV